MSMEILRSFLRRHNWLSLSTLLLILIEVQFLLSEVFCPHYHILYLGNFLFNLLLLLLFFLVLVRFLYISSSTNFPTIWLIRFIVTFGYYFQCSWKIVDLGNLVPIHKTVDNAIHMINISQLDSWIGLSTVYLQLLVGLSVGKHFEQLGHEW